eukprot:gnl/MRDRNA2_/MRDRNA2_99458_c0_seq1.p1 gnl/MRDRNA2_/MRDRNA2_99458_c0~~gnl/MRDRNA2_/MRDRNA2_99458_c0_seq1.p1  ORF type:complete len:479 (+),score=89.60 gnl/MRDRNA2_/MRDRNA2_99458_c0_seq1:65-1438(+)
MRGSTVSILLTVAVKAHAQEFATHHTSIMQKSVEDKVENKLSDGLLDRALSALPFRPADFDTSVLGKPGRVAIPQQAKPLVPLASPLRPTISSRIPSHSPLMSRPHHLPISGGSTKSWASQRMQTRRSAIAERTKEERDARVAGRDQYNPESYKAICDDVAESIKDGLTDGLKLMEVEFPAVPGGDASYKGSSDLFIDNNIQYAISIASKVHKETGKKIQLLLPDGIEYRRAKDKFKTSLEFADGVTLNSLSDTDDFEGSFGAQLNTLFSGQGLRDRAAPEEPTAFDADMYVLINLSTNDLPEVEKFVGGKAKDKAVVFLNDELDTLRADLGLPFFPSKDTHYKFLSLVKPVFYLRSRDYSKSVNVAPFLINYSGALFREYPGPWQVMIKQKESGALLCVAEDRNRWALGAAKEEMLKSLGLAEEEGSTMQFLRTGYKKKTWWEEELQDEVSDAWRT